jgi:hypothetical protein
MVNVNVVPNQDAPHPVAAGKKMPRISISVQNVCSLNISKPCHKTYSKITAVTKSESKVVFLCDTRLNSSKQVAGVNDIRKKFNFLGYALYHNSTKNSRGTAILISNKLTYTVKNTLIDTDCNILYLCSKLGLGQ